MQIAIIVVIVVVAVGLVMWPLLRTPGGAGAGDLDPLPDRRDDAGLEDVARPGSRAPAPVAAAAPGNAPVPGTAPAPRTAPPPGPAPAPPSGGSTTSARAPAPVPGETGSEELPQAAPPPAEPPRPPGSAAGRARTAGSVGSPASPIETEILEYRAALRAHTICRFCSTASPHGSKYCKECGEKLA